MYHFMEGWWFESRSISLPLFAREQFLNTKSVHSYWGHIRSWWPHRHDPAVLFLCYEDMKQDLPLTVQRIAAFIGCALDDELLDLVVRQSSIEFMRVHQRQFDDHLIREARDTVCGLPLGGDSSKVRTGNVGDHTRELPQEIIAALECCWHEEIAIPLGFPSYAALRAALSR